ncbi:MAG: prepilin-type N-terminal cleavage/methylation domain-containing protein [Sedimentisphaerales bacterium]|jgi:prepilin-type N-terminal cleavage/methylation domain-containing protein
MNKKQHSTHDARRNTQYGFTLVELVVAIGVMAMVVLFAGTVFKASIAAYRVATAQAEVMQKFRAITDQLNNDFQGLRKDGYLMLYSTYAGTAPNNFRSDRLYFFSTGDFQSWYNSTVRSNIARIYLGHDRTSFTYTVNYWRLVQDINLLTPGMSGGDYNDVNFAWCQVHPTEITNNANAMFLYPPYINTADSNTLSRLLCENAGQFKIEWTDGTIDAGSGAIAWFGFYMQRSVGSPPDIPADILYGPIESYVTGSYYEATWLPSTPAVLWPTAIKFTFTLYDSHGRNGQTFTHIVYIGD